MDIKGTRTEANLMSAFAGETQARSKYDYFAKAAQNEGFEQIAAIFRETADNEKAHAYMWFELLGGITNTTGNLQNAASGEHFEWTDMYRKFAEEADTEGFKDRAAKFRMVADIEEQHEKRFLKPYGAKPQMFRGIPDVCGSHACRCAAAVRYDRLGTQKRPSQA